MSSDDLLNENGSDDYPWPPRKDAQEGAYALGIWAEGQTLYQFGRNPLRDGGAKWNQVEHFEHDDDAVQRINFQNATAEPQSNDDGGIQAVWIYTEALGSAESKNSAETETEVPEDGKKSRSNTNDNDNRELGEIGKDTTYHRALCALNRLSDGESHAVPVEEIIKETTDPEGTVYSAMTTLYEKKLANRKELERDGKRNVNGYWVSEMGDWMLDELAEQ